MTVVESTTLSAEELAWCEWLKSLPAYKFHWLVGSWRELDWHDDFVNGIAELADLDAVINTHFHGYVSDMDYPDRMRKL